MLWKNIIIEWANCLNLTKQVNTIDELKDGQFFTNLLHLLTKREIADFIGECYPNIIFSNCAPLKNMGDDDIIALASVLMHYSCLMDQRRDLTEPLCDSLTGEMQLMIRCFLETFHAEMNNSELQDSIKIALCKRENAPRTPTLQYQWHSAGDSPIRGKSPLHDFLKTPGISRTSKLQEKDKQIKKLKHELQMEKFEKEDMAMELKEHKEKIKKISEQVCEKSEIISKLHGELTALENRTPPHKPRNFQEMERILRSELLNSQHYISQLQAEQDELGKERDSLSNRLRQIEEEACMWQMKALTVEKEHDALTEKNTEHELELSALRINCNELTALLDEFRQKQHNDSCYELDASEAKMLMNENVGCEDLASSVIDIQLKEARQESEKLRVELKETVNSSLELQNQLAKLQMEFNDLNNNYKEVKLSNVMYEEQISTLTNTQLEIQMSNQNLLQEVTQLTNKNSFYEHEIHTLQSSVFEMNKTLCERDNLAASLTKDLASLTKDHESLEELMSERNEQYKKLENEANNLQKRYEESVQNFNDQKFASEQLAKMYKGVSENIDVNLKNLEEQICGTRDMNFDGNCDIFDDLLCKIVARDNETAEYKQSCEMKLQIYADTIQQLELSIESLANKQRVSVKNAQLLTDNLQKARNKTHELEIIINEKNDKITELNDVIALLNDSVSDFEKLKEECTEKDGQIKVLESVKEAMQTENRRREIQYQEEKNTIETLIKELQIVQLKSQGDIKNRDERIVELEQGKEKHINAIKDLESMKDDIVKKAEEIAEENRRNLEKLLESGEKERKYLETMNQLNTKIESSEQQLEKLQTDLLILENNIGTKNQQLSDLKKFHAQVEEQFKIRSDDLIKRINLLESTENKMTVQIRDLLDEKNEVDLKLAEELQRCQNLNEEKEGYLNHCEELKVQITDLNKVLIEKDSRCKDKDEVISKSTQELLQTKLELETKKEEVKDLKEQTEHLHEEKIMTKASIEELQKQCAVLETRIHNVTMESDVLNKHKNDIDTKYEQMEQNVLTVFHQIGIKNMDLHKGLEALVEFKEELEAEVVTLRTSLAESTVQLEQANEERLTATGSYEKQIKELTATISDLSLEIDTLNTKEIGSLQEIGMLKEELKYTMDKYTEAKQIEEDLKQENETQINGLTENLHTMVKNYNELDKKHLAILSELNYSRITIEEISKEKQKLEIDLIQQKKEFEEEIFATADQYKVELEALTKNEIKLKNDIESLSKELDNTKGSKHMIHCELEKAKEDLLVSMDEKSHLLTRVESLIETNKNFEYENANLKIQYENYLRESRLTLSKTQIELQEKIVDLKAQISQNEKRIGELNGRIAKYQEESSKKIEERECELKKHAEEVASLLLKIADYEDKFLRLKSEKEACLEEIKKLDESNQLKDMTINESENKITSFQCAFDILETGKNNMEEKHAELLQKYNELLMSKNNDDLSYNNVQTILQLKIDELQEQIREKKNDIAEKNKMIQGLHSENETIGKVMEIMKEQHENVCQDRDVLRNTLDIIEECNENKLKKQFAKFTSLKTDYDNLKEEMKDIEAEYENLKEELVVSSQMKAEADNEIRELQNELLSLRADYESVTTILTNKNHTISVLQEELDTRLDNVEHLAWEKRCTEIKLQHTNDELTHMSQALDEIKQKHTSLIKETENNLLRAHDNAVDVKNDLLRRVELSDKEKLDAFQHKEAVDKLLQQEKKSRQFFELQLLELTNERNQCRNLQKKLKLSVERLANLVSDKSIESTDDVDLSVLNEMIMSTENRIVEIFSKTRELNETIQVLEKEKSDIVHKLEVLNHSNEELSGEKDKVMEQFDCLHKEKLALQIDKDKDSKCIENLKTQFKLLQEKYDASTNQESKQNMQVQIKMEELKQTNTKQFNEYQQFLSASKQFKKEIDKMISSRNALENLVMALKENHVTLQIKSIYICEDLHRLHHEQKITLETIIDDIQKQFNRLSKIVYNTSLNTVQIFEKTVTGILTDKAVNWQLLFKELNVDEILMKLEDLHFNAQNTLDQLSKFEKAIEMLNENGELKPRVLKENVEPLSQTQKPKEEDWKKKYLNLKQRLILVENTKSNYEKKIKLLREEIKTQKPKEESGEVQFSDEQYKQLLQQHIQAKEENERVISDYDAKYKALLQECRQQNKCNLDNRQYSELKLELDNIRDAYSKVKSENYKHELNTAALQKMLDDRNAKLTNLQCIKEAYEKLFEENNKLMSELDTLKYKRTKDREEYVRLIEKEKKDSNKKLQDTREEYEIKLAKMKDKMIQLYKEEVDKQIVKVASEKEQNDKLIQNNERLNHQLREANQQIRIMESEKMRPPMQTRSVCGMETLNSRDSLGCRESTSRSLAKMSSTHSLGGSEVMRNIDERRYSTLPKNMTGMDVIEEVHIRRRTSFTSVPQANIEMEDESDMFNNKYLVDMKEGRFSISSTGRESTSSRMSELAYRNSLCPPHLKSSYPAETQFLNPRRFRDDDIKSGQVDLDDSMSTRLLPQEKSKRKDAGTTSYKRPGPPTPSKNGGRLSLQSNEPHPRDALREANDKAPRQRTTPNRLKMLFSRSKGSENVPVTPKGKRLSIFRKP